MTRSKLVVVGGSIAGMTVVKTLRQNGYGGEIIALDPDLSAPYRRPGASKALVTGACEVEDLALPWEESWKCQRLVGARATGLDPEGRILSYRLGDEQLTVDFDTLVIATGSEPRVPEVSWAHDVVTIRSADDGAALRERAVPGMRAVVVGAGFLGLEVAASLTKRSAKVTVVEAAPELFGARFGPELSGAIEELHAERGVRILKGLGVQEIIAQESGQLVVLADGTQLAADLVVWSTGAKPTVDWLGDSLGSVAQGIDCDEYGQVLGYPAIYALGDVARWHHPRYQDDMRIEHWTSAIDQGRVVAAHLIDHQTARPIDVIPYVWSDQFDRTFQALGVPGLGTERVILPSQDGSTVVGFLDGQRLVGVAGLVASGAEIMSYRKRVSEESRVQEAVATS